MERTPGVSARGLSYPGDDFVFGTPPQRELHNTDDAFREMEQHKEVVYARFQIYNASNHTQQIPCTSSSNISWRLGRSKTGYRYSRLRDARTWIMYAHESSTFGYLR